MVKFYIKDEDISELEPDTRSHKGIFLAFQYPVEIPGVNNEDFLRLAYNSKQKALDKKRSRSNTIYWKLFQIN